MMGPSLSRNSFCQRIYRFLCLNSFWLVKFYIIAIVRMVVFFLSSFCFFLISSGEKKEEGDRNSRREKKMEWERIPKEGAWIVLFDRSMGRSVCWPIEWLILHFVCDFCVQYFVYVQCAYESMAGPSINNSSHFIFGHYLITDLCRDMPLCV